MKAKFLFFAALAVMMAACVPTENPDPVDEFVPEFKVSGVKNNTISVGADKKDVTVSVTSNLSWSVTCQADWVRIDPSSYTAKEDKTSETVKVKVSVYANELEESRETELVFGAEGVEPVKVTLKQAAKEYVGPTIAVVDSNLSPIEGYTIKAYGVGEDVKFTVSATANWTVEAPDWVTVTPTSFTYTDNDIQIVTVSFEMNLDEAKSGEIRFKGDFKEDFVIPISQASIPTIGLKLGEVTPTSAAFTTNPSDKEQLYMIMCENKSYVDQYETDEDLLQGELEFFEELADRNKISLEEVISEYANYGDIDDAFDELHFDSDYVIYAYCITLDGKIVSRLEKIDVHTESYDFKFAGTAIWHDVAMGEMFSAGQRDLPCDVYTVEGLDGHYFFRSPYNYANLCGWFIDATPEEFFPYKDEVTKDVYIEIDCTDPSAVVYELQEIGLNVNDEYGWMSVGSTYGQYNFTGTFENNVISFTSNLLVLFPVEGKLYGVDLAKKGKFTITIDTDATESVYPKDPEVPEVPETSIANVNYKSIAPSVSNQFTGKKISKRTILK